MSDVRPAADQDPDIQRLEALEAVRRRPQLYLPECGPEPIANYLLKEALCEPLREHQCGHVDRIHILLTSSRSATIQHQGPGLPVKQLSDGSNSPLDDALAQQLCRGSIVLLTAFSQCLLVENQYEGNLWIGEFRNGVLSHPFTNLGPADEPLGTRLRFTLDPSFVPDQFDLAELRQWATTLAPAMDPAALQWEQAPPQHWELAPHLLTSS